MVHNTPTYALSYPDSTDVADVPAHMQDLAKDVESALNQKLNTTDLRGKVITTGTTLGANTIIIVATSAPSPTGLPDNTILFLVQP